MMNKKNFNLKNARLFLGYSQSKLAEKLGWTAQQVSNIETNRNPMQKQTQLAVECLLRQKGKWEEFYNYKK